MCHSVLLVWHQKMTCQFFFSQKFRCDDFFLSSDKIPHLCTCRCDTDLTISLFTTRGPTFSDKEYALRPQPSVPPVKPGLPSARCGCVEKISEIQPHTTDIELFFNCRRSVIAPGNNCRNNMCQSPWGALHPALHELRGYGWLKLYGMEGGGGPQVFQQGKGAPAAPLYVAQWSKSCYCACKRLKRIFIHEIR